MNIRCPSGVINFSGEDRGWLALRQGLQRHGTRAVRPGGRHVPAAAADSHRFRAVPVECLVNLGITLGFCDGNRAIPGENVSLEYLGILGIGNLDD